MELEKHLSSEVIRLDLTASTKEDAIAELVRLLCQSHRLQDSDTILQTIYQRESDKSTGIGHTVAIPHARTGLVKRIYLAFGRSRQGIEWGSVDGQPVHFIFLVVGPEKASEDYLRVLADISRLMTHAPIREALLEVKSPTEVLRMISQYKMRDYGMTERNPRP